MELLRQSHLYRGATYTPQIRWVLPWRISWGKNMRLCWDSMYWTNKHSYECVCLSVESHCVSIAGLVTKTSFRAEKCESENENTSLPVCLSRPSLLPLSRDASQMFFFCRESITLSILVTAHLWRNRKCSMLHVLFLQSSHRKEVFVSAFFKAAHHHLWIV